MTNPTERVVHAVLPDGGEVVRYDRAGKWYVEWPPQLGRKRLPVTVKQAAGIAEAFHQEDGAYVHLGRYGGQRFVSAYRELEWVLRHDADPESIRSTHRALVATQPRIE